MALAIYAGAYLTEIFSAGIVSVGKRYLEAGRSLGLSRTQTAISITLPIMFRTVLPSLGDPFIGLFKDTSIAVAIAAPELTWAARQDQHRLLPLHRSMGDRGSDLPGHLLWDCADAALDRTAHQVDGGMNEVWESRHLLWLGLKLTLQLGHLVWRARIIGLLVGVGLTYGNRVVRTLLRLYVDIVRGLPILVVLFLIYYILPAVDLNIFGRHIPTNIGRFQAAALGLSLFGAAQVGEVVRRGARLRTEWADRRGQIAGADVLATADSCFAAANNAGHHSPLDQYRTELVKREHRSPRCSA